MTTTSRAFSILIGATAAVAGWIVFAAVRDELPVWLRVVAAGAVIVFGPGAGFTAGLLAPLSWLARVVLAFSFGVALAPVLTHVLGPMGLLGTYPYFAAALGGAAFGSWRLAPRAPAPAGRTRLAVAVLVVVALGMGITAFANRMTASRGTTTVYGAYDSYDLTYYAAIAAELSHTVPPASPFYAGRMLNHAFYPHAALAMVARFGHVPLLDLYFRYAWPAFLVLAVLVCFVFVQSISNTATAWISAVLFGAGSNLAYAAGWFFTLSNWDDVIWSHNFQGAGAEVLLYGNWTPALIAMFAGLFALHACFRGTGLGWAVLAGAMFATTVLSKPWIFAGITAALAVVALTMRREREPRRRLALVLACSVVIAAPLLYRTMTLFDDAQVTFAPAFFPIPLVMAERIGLREWFLTLAGALGVTNAAQTALAAGLAAPLFFVGSMGFRLVGIPAWWRSLRRPADHDPIWRVLGWTVLALIGASTFIVSIPYHETTQIHQCALFLLALFTGKALASVVGWRARVAATAVVIAVAVPAMVQYLSGKWQDWEHPLAQMSQAEVSLADVLSGTDPERTVILHDRPNDPWLPAILSARRSALAWAGYVRGSESRRDDVEAFFSAPEAPRALEILKACRPTHIVEYRSRDHVNQAIKDQLELMFSSGDVALYRVPERLLAQER